MSDETQANLPPAQAAQAEETQHAKDVQELRALCRRMATRLEDMERRLRRLEADG